MAKISFYTGESMPIPSPKTMLELLIAVEAVFKLNARPRQKLARAMSDTKHPKARSSCRSRWVIILNYCMALYSISATITRELYVVDFHFEILCRCGQFWLVQNWMNLPLCGETFLSTRGRERFRFY